MTSDSTVVPLRQPDAVDDPLTMIFREGARRLLAQAIEAEAEAFRRDEPLHLLINSTGLKTYGEGEWLDQNMGSGRAAGGASCSLVLMQTSMKSSPRNRFRTTWRRSQVPELLDQVDAPSLR